jgi:tyrosine-protein kinase Etk/Wzc
VTDTSMDLAIEELASYVKFDVNEEETTISITVIDKDPKRAAEMANYFVEMLNIVSLNLATREAKTNREFIGKRLEDARAELKSAEDALRAYQEKEGVVLSPDLSPGSIDAVAELYAMKARKELELSILERTVSEGSDVVTTLRVELSELNKKLANVPEVGLESFRLHREAAIQQKILEFLVPMHEQAKIDEQKDVPVILVLDRAVPAEKKYKPKRALLVASAAVISLLVSLLIVFAASHLEALKLANASDYESMKNRFSDAKAGKFFRRG